MEIDREKLNELIRGLQLPDFKGLKTIRPGDDVKLMEIGAAFLRDAILSTDALRIDTTKADGTWRLLSEPRDSDNMVPKFKYCPDCGSLLKDHNEPS